MIYTVTLNPAIDCILGLDQLQPGTIQRCTRENIFFGGKGINVSIILRRLGIDSTALGFTAGFTGIAIEDGLRQEGIACDFVHLSQGITRMNIKIYADEETALNGQGPRILPEDLHALFEKLDSLRAGDTLVLAGSVPAGLLADTYAQILSRLQGRNIRFVLDAAGPLLEEALAYRPFLIKPNQQELEALYGASIDTREDLITAARQLQQRGAQNVLVSLGEQGALLLTDAGQIYGTPAVCGQVINTVGAGDSMLAGYLAGLERGQSPHQALRLATACGGATAFSVGLAAQDAIRELYEAVG